MILAYHDESSNSLHPLLVNPPYKLTLSIKRLTTPKSPKEKNYIPRPNNPFIIFRSDLVAKLKATAERKVPLCLISKMASEQWKNESEAVKSFFKLLSEIHHHHHRILYPNYTYSPRIKKSRSKTQEKSKEQIKCITWYANDINAYADINICKTEGFSNQPRNFINYAASSNIPILTTTSVKYGPTPLTFSPDYFIFENFGEMANNFVLELPETFF